MTINDLTIEGVRPGKGFRDALLAPLEVKDYVTNESRLEHGHRHLSLPTKYKNRTVSLEFQIVGRTAALMEQSRERLFAEFYKGEVKLHAPEFTNRVFHLLYIGKTSTYSSGLSGRACKVKVSFDEPNPGNRM